METATALFVALPRRCFARNESRRRTDQRTHPLRERVADGRLSRAHHADEVHIDAAEHPAELAPARRDARRQRRLTRVLRGVHAAGQREVAERRAAPRCRADERRGEVGTRPRVAAGQEQEERSASHARSGGEHYLVGEVIFNRPLVESRIGYNKQKQARNGRFFSYSGLVPRSFEKVPSVTPDVFSRSFLCWWLFFGPI